MIFYFSGTGNTRWAANKVASEIGDSTVDIADEMNKVVGTTDKLRYQLSDKERIGFFFPVHGWRPPVIVRKFISRLDTICGNHYCYAVCTAGDNIGETIDIFKNDLVHTGLTLQSAISLIMPESYVGMPFMDVDKPDKEKYKKETADHKLSAFIESIKNEECGISDLVIGRWPRINSRFIGSIFVKKLINDKHFRVDEQRCIRCGKCAEICPVNDIKGGKGLTPEWTHNGRCLTCFACYHHCPVRAIDFGQRTKGKGQYYFEKR